jgi:hypothetical protein
VLSSIELVSFIQIPEIRLNRRDITGKILKKNCDEACRPETTIERERKGGEKCVQ